MSRTSHLAYATTLALFSGVLTVTAPAAAHSAGTSHTVAASQGGALAERAARPRLVALTFDDGPSPYTNAILAVLRRNKVHATFFALGTQVRKYPSMSRKIVREGHRLGDHSWNHPDLTRLSNADARSQVTRTRDQIQATTHVTVTAFRFPYGSSNARTRDIVRRCHLRIVGWNVDPQDWAEPAPSTITSRILDAVRPGRTNIVIMHDGGGNRRNTIASLDNTIRALKKRGYHFVLA